MSGYFTNEQREENLVDLIKQLKIETCVSLERNTHMQWTTYHLQWITDIANMVNVEIKYNENN